MSAGSKAEAATNGEKEGGDPSMEEILQSIRKIIADDEPAAKKTSEEEGDVQGSDILELTEMVKEDGTVVSLKSEAAPVDILNQIDQALAPEKTADKVPEKAAEPSPEKAPEKVAEIPVEKPVAKPAEPPAVKAAEKPVAKPEAVPAAVPVDSLLAAETAAAAAESFKKLKVEPDLPDPVTTPAPSFRSGITMEDMVADMLRPLLKAWLDANLPAIVERIVEREVRKLTK